MPGTVERKALSEELNSLRENMETIATLSVQAIERAVAGLDSPDTGVVGDVSALDREVYGLKERIVRNCVETIALHAPVAKDLRTITVALEVTTDLDRIGRYAKDIADKLRPTGRTDVVSSGRRIDLAVSRCDATMPREAIARNTGASLTTLLAHGVLVIRCWDHELQCLQSTRDADDVLCTHK